MKTSTRLLVGMTLAIALTATGCGDGNGDPPAADAGADAGADGSPLGDWKLAAVTDLAGTVTDVDSEVGGTVQRVNGTLSLDASGAGAFVALRLTAGRLLPLDLDAFVGGYTLEPDLTTINLAGEGFTVTYSAASPESLVLANLSGASFEYKRFAAEDEETISLAGHATIEAGAPVLDTPRVGLVMMLRSNGVEPPFTQVGEVETGADVALAGLDDGADFTLARTSGALGFESIHFGVSGAAIAVGLVVAYEDRDHDGKLGRFEIDDCAVPGVDCIRGFAGVQGQVNTLPVAIAYRTTVEAPELESAGFGFLRAGWAAAAVVEDQDSALTLVPLDPTTAPVPFDVEFAADPTLLEFPDLDFGPAS